MEIEDAITIDADEPASKALSEAVRRENLVAVTKGGKYVGIMDERSLRGSAVELERMKCGSLCAKPPQLSKNSTLKDVCNAFFTGHYKALPVVEKDKLLGMISRKSVLEALVNDGYLKGRKVADAMSSPIISIEASEKIGKARALLHKHNLRRLLVVKAGKIEGMLAMRDLAKAKVFGKQSPSMMQEKVNTDLQPVSSFMQKQVETIESASSLSEAAQKMLKGSVSTLVVSDGLQPIGMLSARDVFETLITAQHKSNVYISGMSEEDRERYPDIAQECEASLEKMEKSATIEYLSVHIKKTGSEYFVRGRLMAKHLYTASASDWKLTAAIGAMLHEFTEMIREGKPQKMHKRKGKDE